MPFGDLPSSVCYRGSGDVEESIERIECLSRRPNRLRNSLRVEYTESHVQVAVGI